MTRINERPPRNNYTWEMQRSRGGGARGLRDVGMFDGGDNEAQRWTTASSSAAVTDSDDDLMEQGIVSVFLGGRPRRWRRRIMSGLKFIGCPLGCCGKLLFHSCPPCSAYVHSNRYFVTAFADWESYGGAPLWSWCIPRKGRSFAIINIDKGWLGDRGMLFAKNTLNTRRTRDSSQNY